MNDPVEMRFMEEALALAARAASEGEVPVGAVVVRDGVVIGRGYNRREQDQDFAAHAEFLAMREAQAALGSWRLCDCTVYVTLEPCPMCAGAMVLSRVGGCVYGATDPKGGFLGTTGDLSAHPAMNHHFRVVPGLLADRSAALLQSFFRELRRR